MTGKQKVINVINGVRNDVHPNYDILRNDDIIEYYAGEKLTFENAPRVTKLAAMRAVDGTRGIPRLPDPESDKLLPDGRRVYTARWTSWTENYKINDTDAYIASLKKHVQSEILTESEIKVFLDSVNLYHSVQEEYFKDIAFFWALPYTGGFISGLYGGIGMEQYAYIAAEDTELSAELMNYRLEKAVKVIEHIPEDKTPFGIFVGDDIAYKTGLLVNPSLLEKGYYANMKRFCDAAHKKGIYVMFHSDGCLNEVLDGLVDAGIDFLNPFETMANMDVKTVHTKYPKIIIAGGIDVSQLLPFGSPGDVERAVKQAIEDAEGKILVGSSTEVNDKVPLENYLALKKGLVY